MTKTFMIKTFNLALFALLFTLLNCEKEEPIEISNTSINNRYYVKLIEKEEYSGNKKLLTRLEPFQKNNASGSNLQRKDVYNSEYNFTIDTDHVKYVESLDGSLHSYTFLLKRNEGSELIENLVFTIQPDGSYDAKLLGYNITDDSLEINTTTLLNIDPSDYLHSRTTISCISTYRCTSGITRCDDCDALYPKWYFDCSTYELIDTTCTVDSTYDHYTACYTPDCSGGSGGGSGGDSGGIDGVFVGGSGSSSNTESTEETPDIVTSPVIDMCELSEVATTANSIAQALGYESSYT